jgi:hypothetical protein
MVEPEREYLTIIAAAQRIGVSLVEDYKQRSPKASSG